jgi:hypothetical protein
MQSAPSSASHPLDGVSEWECYDQHISERNKLISAKREAEDGFVKTIIQLSSAIVLAVPSVLALDKSNVRVPSFFLMAGIALVGLSLVLALSEQFMSSVAYKKQIEKTDLYYTKMTSDVSPPLASKFVQFSLAATFAVFVTGILLVSSALLISPWRQSMAHTPTPRPTPAPIPSPPTPTPKHDVPGRSVPPTPPPSPPTSPRR